MLISLLLMRVSALAPPALHDTPTLSSRQKHVQRTQTCMYIVFKGTNIHLLRCGRGDLDVSVADVLVLVALVLAAGPRLGGRRGHALVLDVVRVRGGGAVGAGLAAPRLPRQPALARPVAVLGRGAGERGLDQAQLLSSHSRQI